MPPDERHFADVGLALLEPLESLVHPSNGDAQNREVAPDGVDLYPEGRQLGADFREAAPDLFTLAAHFSEEADHRHQEQPDERPGLGVVHLFRIGHAPRAREYPPCNYEVGE